MFNKQDLEAGVRRIAAIHPHAKARFASFEVDFAQHELRKRGIRIRLQHKPFQILELLLLRPGTLITREELARSLWPDSHVGFEHGLNTAMNILRQALGDSAPGSRFIETRPGLGYRFIAPVELIADDTSRDEDTWPVHHDCLKGRYFLDKITEEDARKAAAHFQAALLDQGDSVDACCGLVDSYCQMAELATLAPANAAAMAREYAIAAISGGSHRPEAHAAMGRIRAVFDWDWKRAATCFKRAVELQQNSGPTHRFYAQALSIMGDHAGALEHIRFAQSAAPLSLQLGLEHAWLLQAAGEFEAATQQCWKVLTLETHCWAAQVALATAYAEMGMRNEAVAELKNAVVCSQRNPIALGLLTYWDSSESGALAWELAEQQKWRYVNPLALALAQAGRGEIKAAQDYIRQALAEHDTTLLWLRRSSPIQHIWGSPPILGLALEAHKRE